MTVAVVGAGLAGSTLAVLLAQAGRSVEVFDKGRGAGGRLATRRHESGRRFDHGCPGIALTEADALASVMATVVEKADAARWDGPFGPMAVGIPGMSAIVKALLGPIPVTTSFEVGAAERGGDGWRLVSRTGERQGPYEALFVTVPAPQLPPILADAAPDLAATASGARYDPAWTAMLAFDADVAGRLATLAPDTLAGEGVEMLIHDGGKPGRDGAPTLVCHMSAAWTTANLERERPDVAAELGPRIAGALGLVAPSLSIAHRWRYARVRRLAEVPVPYDAARAVGVAGDWTAGPDARDAFASAARCAEAFIRATAS